jgi:small conductance mechanosensitive channel
VKTMAFSVGLSSPADTIVAKLYESWHSFLEAVPRLGFALVAIALTALLGRLIPRAVVGLTRRAIHRGSLRDLIRQLTFIAVWIIGLLIAGMIVFPSLTPGNLIAVVGLGSVAIGFAFKDIFENFFAGALILWRFPLEAGDLIECEGIEGRVEDITIRNTLLRCTDGQLVVVPNATLFNNPVTVRTSLEVRRVTLTCGIEYDENVDEAREVMQRALTACKTVRRDRPVEIFAQELAESGINFEVTWWTGSQPLEVRSSRDEVVAAIKRALDEADVGIPYPSVAIAFKQPLQVIDESHVKLRENGQAKRRTT